MTNQNNAAQAANENPLSDEYVNAIIQRHGYDSPETVIARLAQWIGLNGGEDGVTLLMYEAHKALSKLRAPVAPAVPKDTQEYTLRAMGRNYSGGHSWDRLDTECVTAAADEIRVLRAALASTPDTAKEKADKILRERMAPVSKALGLDVMLASAGNGVIQIFTFEGGPLVYTIRADGTAIQRVSWNQPDAPDTLTVDQVKIITQEVSETQPEPQPPRAAVAGEAVGKVVLFGDDLKEVSWTAGKMPPPGTALYAAPQASAEAFDFAAHLARQAEFSALTFGPGSRVAGICDHIRKELIEVENSGGDLKEWVDVIILGLDGAWRSGATPQEIIAAIVAKQAKNEARTWPDWRTVDPNKAIEHDRGGQP